LAAPRTFLRARSHFGVMRIMLPSPSRRNRCSAASNRPHRAQQVEFRFPYGRDGQGVHRDPQRKDRL
jgi:hypothetical protein